MKLESQEWFSDRDLRRYRPIALDTKPPKRYSPGWHCLPDRELKKFLGHYPDIRIIKGFQLTVWVFADRSMNSWGFAGLIPRNIDRKSLQPHINANHGVEFPDEWIDLLKMDGNRTPKSYLQASLLSREAAEIGAFWHGVSSWRWEYVIGDWIKGPATDGQRIDVGFEDCEIPLWNSGIWTVLSDSPIERFDPVVNVIDDYVEVVFYTYRGLGLESIIEHRDYYGKRTDYLSISKETVIAEGVSSMAV